MAQLLFEQNSFLRSVVIDYVKWLKSREKADLRDITPFQQFDGMHGSGYRCFYIIKKGKFVAVTVLTIYEFMINRYHYSEVAGMIEDSLLKTCRMAEAEWQAYWSGNLWC